MFANRPILAPVDLSEASDRALEFALKMASSPKQVMAVHVGVPYVFVEPAFIPLFSEEERRAKLEEAVQEHFAADKFRKVPIHVEFGDPGERIAAVAKEIGAGLIVMPSHGRTGLPHLLIGSVAERVIRLAPCPVLVLRGNWKASNSNR
jgi:nucleotide-binding universal stress UspA family protein